jgi:hypothetical protein
MVLFEKTKITPNDLVLCFAQKALRYNHQEPDTDFSLKPDEIRTEVTSFLKVFHPKTPEEIIQWIFLRLFIKHKPIPCSAGENTFHLNPYGQFTYCSLSNRIVGSLRNGLVKRAAPKSCFCFTPCESYFGILKMGHFALWQALF